MHRFDRKQILILAFASSVSMLSAATPAIGVAVSQGNIVVDSAQTAGNTTIFDGNTLQTGKVSSQVRLKDGAQVRFASQSRGKLFSDHVDLQQGSAQISGYAAIANGLSIRPEGTSSAAVSIHGKAVQVAALSGNVHVFNSQGINVANLVPGRALSLAPQDAGASAPSSLTGCPVKEKDNFFLTDESSRVTVQLRGGKVKNRKRVTVTGAIASNVTPASPATQVINVASAKEIGGQCTPAAIAAAAGGAGAAGAAAGAAAGGAAAGGAISGTTIAVLAGLGAAVAAGTAAAIATSGGTTSP